MLDFLKSALDDLLGLSLEAKDLDPLQTGLRALLIYLAVLAVIRVGHKRFLGKATAFDVVVGIMVGSIASRAINGSAPILPTLVACIVIVAAHAAIAWTAYRSRTFSVLVEGKPVKLVVDGKHRKDELRRRDITEEDLLESMRAHGVADPDEVQLAVLERNGQITVLKRGA